MSKGPAASRRTATAKRPSATRTSAPGKAAKGPAKRSATPRRSATERRMREDRRASSEGRTSLGRRETPDRRAAADRRGSTTARAAARPAAKRSTAAARSAAKAAPKRAAAAKAAPKRIATASSTTSARASKSAAAGTRRASTNASAAAKKVATKPAPKRAPATARAAAKAAPKRAAAAKPAAKRNAAKPAARRATASSTAAKRPAAKPTAVRTAPKRAAAKPAVKRGATTARAAAKPAAKRVAAKSVAKKAPAKTPTSRTATARAAAKPTAARTAPKRATATARTAAKPAPKPARAPAKRAATQPAAAAKPTTARPSTAHDVRVLQARLDDAAVKAGVPSVVLERQRHEDFYAVMEWLVPRRSRMPRGPVRAVTEAAEALLRHRVFVHPGADGAPVVPVVFGTGGHRGVIGTGLTLLHVHVIVTALLRAIAAMQSAQRAEVFGERALAEVKRRGFVLGHDNRLFNPEFSYYAASLLRDAGYSVRYAGRISSPEFSLMVPLQGWAGSLNFTPSHNPFRWGGLKFAPADGGLAGGDLTDPLAAEANRLLQATKPAQWPAPDALEARIAAEAERIERVDLHDTYLDALDRHPVVRLSELIAELKALPAGERLALVADPTWGAAVPVYQHLLRRMGPEILQLLHTEVDPYFGGQVTEPNEQTLTDALRVLRRTSAPRKVMIRNDPDSDRGLVGDEAGAIQMNRFAPLVFRYLREIGQRGELVTTLPTSQMGPDYARRHGSDVQLTPTGFKNFRPLLKGGKAVVAYEESNGLTIRGHTLDKDGILAGLLAVRIVLHYGRPLSDLVAEMEAELGHYYYRQETFAIDMSAADAHRRLKKLGETRPGDSFQAGGQTHPILAIDAQDGYRFDLDDGAWVMMRPSGTEPKVRVYAETRESPQATAALCEAARELALAAVHSS